MKTKNTKYSIGLDIGTASVGFAVIDEQYQLVKKTTRGKVKNLWGTRLFNEAKSAKERRVYRSTRRRYNKRRERIRQLKYLMNEMIMEVDSTFFIRLEHLSSLHTEDKLNEKNKFYISNVDYNLFVDQDFNDKVYYTKFPTIYHLRHYLMHTKEKADPRLIYLAIHHILKYRGNFLYEGQTFQIDDFDLKEVFERIWNQLFEEASIILSNDDITIITSILVTDTNRSEKQVALYEYLKQRVESKQKEKRLKELTKMIVGINTNCKVLFDNEHLLNGDKPMQLSFNKSYEEDLQKFEEDLTDYLELIAEIKTINDWMVLKNILKDSNENSISAAMIANYESHREDLNCLKVVLKEKKIKGYHDFFKNKAKKNNYYQYIHHPATCDYGNFLKNITNLIQNIDDERLLKIKQKIEKETLFMKQNSKFNALIPYQLNLMELQKILENQIPYYAHLQKNKDKIIALLTFRIPYYYGPLNPMNLDNHWIVKREGKEDERITAWNHQDIVDKDKTAKNFINRMKNYCTYFVDEPVLPKSSLIVSQFEVLNELNKIRVNGKLLSVDLKNKIFEEVFIEKAKVTDSILREYLKKTVTFLNDDNLEITGYQKEKCFATSLKPWRDFIGIFQEINNDNFEMIEQIIYDLTVFKDKSILKNRLKKMYKLDDVKVQRILVLKYTGWSRLSRKLLYDIYTPFQEEKLNIIEVMKLSNKNFMEIIHDDTLRFKHIIEEANKHEVVGKFEYDEVKALQGSPALKKGIWQALQVIDEIIKIMKCKPTNIFIEVAREKEEKKRTTSRKEAIKKLLKDVKCDNEQELKNRLNREADSMELRAYLYYTQLGKCMYTGDELDYDYLSTYDIDHIIPQSLVDHNSIDNKVLVKKIENANKENHVLSKKIQSNRLGFWKKLKDANLISERKLRTLMKTQFTEDDINQFVERQIVETRQITKHVINIVNNHLEHTKVVAIRAGLSHQFRKKYHIYKNRNLNDYHHAHDAYIASILGLYILKRYPKLDKIFTYGDYSNLKNNTKNILGDYAFVLNSMDHESLHVKTNEIIWNQDLLSSILKCFDYKDCLISKKLEEFSGIFYKQTIYPNDKHSENGKTKAKVGVNAKYSDVSRYGGYEGINTIPVAIKAKKGSKNNKKIVKEIVSVPLMLKTSSKQMLLEYIKENKPKYSDIEIIEFIKENQLIQENGCCYFIASAFEWNNAQQLILSKSSQKTLFYVNEAIRKERFNKIESENITQLYIEIYEKMNIYYPRLKSKAREFQILEEDFKKLTLKEQCQVIIALLKATKAGKERGDLDNPVFKFSALGRYTKTKIDLAKVTFISQSVTGFYENRLKL